MTIYVVSRHSGALDWLISQFESEGDEPLTFIHLPHFSSDDLAALTPDDEVIGNLPLHIVANICNKGASFYEISVSIPPEKRGVELSADDLTTYGAELHCYHVRRLQQRDPH